MQPFVALTNLIHNNLIKYENNLENVIRATFTIHFLHPYAQNSEERKLLSEKRHQEVDQLINDNEKNYELLTKINQVYQQSGYTFFYFGWYNKDYPGLHINKQKLTPETFESMTLPHTFNIDIFKYAQVKIDHRIVRTWSKHLIQGTIVDEMKKQDMQYLIRTHLGLQPVKNTDYTYKVLNQLNRDYMQIVRGFIKLSHWSEDPEPYVMKDAQPKYIDVKTYGHIKLFTLSKYNTSQWINIYRRLFLTTDYMNWSTIEKYDFIPYEILLKIALELYNYRSTAMDNDNYSDPSDMYPYILKMANKRKLMSRTLEKIDIKLPLNPDENIEKQFEYKPISLYSYT